MGRLVKEKKIIEYWADGKTAPYKLDINTGTMYGLRGSAIKSAPPKFIDTLYCHHREDVVFMVMYRIYRDNSFDALLQHFEALQLFDRLASLGYKGVETGDLRSWRMISDTLNGSPKLFKRVAELIKTDPNCCIYDYLQTVGEDVWREDNGIRIDEHFTEEMAHFLYQVREFDYMKKYFNLVKYWVSKGLVEYNGVYDTRDKLRTFFSYCEYCNYEPQKSDFFRQYIEVKRTTIRLKNERDSVAMAEKQNAHIKALSFEDENFIVIVPQTIKELTDEGNKQHNCVGGYGSQIVNGEKCVVFIRKKENPNTPYITCDIFAELYPGWGYHYPTGKINQYLIHHNNETCDPLALEFKVKYQEHLLANWGN